MRKREYTELAKELSEFFCGTFDEKFSTSLYNVIKATEGDYQHVLCYGVSTKGLSGVGALKKMERSINA